MKTLTSTLAVLILSAGLAAADDMGGISERMAPATSAASGTKDFTGLSTYKQPGPGVTPQSINAPPNPNVVLKPKLGGVFVGLAKYGPVLISPAAPASYGIGEKYLSAPSPMYDTQHESGPAAHRDAGGFKLFSLEF